MALNLTAARKRGLALGILALVLGLAIAAAQAAPALAAGCGTRPATSKPFSAFGDVNNYFLAPNGGLESGATSWTLGGGARVVSGNESYFARMLGDRYSLSLPQGATASTGWICITKDDPSFRFFAKTNGGANYSGLNVSATIKGPSGSVVNHWFAQLTPSGYTSWKASPTFSYSVWLEQPWIYGSGDTVSVKFDFSVQGTGGTWQIDDVFVDPFKGT